MVYWKCLRALMRICLLLQKTFKFHKRVFTVVLPLNHYAIFTLDVCVSIDTTLIVSLTQMSSVHKAVCMLLVYDIVSSQITQVPTVNQNWGSGPQARFLCRWWTVSPYSFRRRNRRQVGTWSQLECNKRVVQFWTDQNVNIENILQLLFKTYWAYSAVPTNGQKELERCLTGTWKHIHVTDLVLVAYCQPWGLHCYSWRNSRRWNPSGFAMLWSMSSQSALHKCRLCVGRLHFCGYSMERQEASQMMVLLAHNMCRGGHRVPLRET